MEKAEKRQEKPAIFYMNQYTRSAMGCQPKNPARGVFRARRITELLAARRPFSTQGEARPGCLSGAEPAAPGSL